MQKRLLRKNDLTPDAIEQLPSLVRNGTLKVGWGRGEPVWTIAGEIPPPNNLIRQVLATVVAEHPNPVHTSTLELLTNKPKRELYCTARPLVTSGVLDREAGWYRLADPGDSRSREPRPRTDPKVVADQIIGALVTAQGATAEQLAATLHIQVRPVSAALNALRKQGRVHKVRKVWYLGSNGASRVLEALVETNGATAVELADQLQLDKGVVSGLLTDMRKQCRVHKVRKVWYLGANGASRILAALKVQPETARALAHTLHIRVKDVEAILQEMQEQGAVHRDAAGQWCFGAEPEPCTSPHPSEQPILDWFQQNPDAEVMSRNLAFFLESEPNRVKRTLVALEERGLVFRHRELGEELWSAKKPLPTEERVYNYLKRNYASSATKIAIPLGLSAREVLPILHELLGRGLVSVKDPHGNAIWSAHSPAG